MDDGCGRWMTRMRIVRSAGPLLLALGAIASACGAADGGELTLQEYFDTIVALDKEGEQFSDELSARLEEDIDQASEAEAIALYRGFLETISASAERELDVLKGLRPPLEATSAHDEYVGAFDGLVSAAEALTDRAGEAETMTDAEELVARGVAPQVREIEKACVELQEVADAGDFDIDLECGE